jgi:hypothetical protein
MVTYFVWKTIDRLNVDDPAWYWYGAGVALLVDALILSLVLSWVKS